ncbi:MAG: beta-aspartyl-peptidase, partial [Exiguobacterium undae]
MILLKEVRLAGESTDVLVGGGKILAIGSYAVDDRLITQTIDGAGKQLVPGLVDGHVHPIGGGGEGGFSTRTAPLLATDFLTGGVTTVVGLLGTDGWTRT